MWRYFFDAQYGVVNAALTQLGITTSYHAFLSSPFAALNIVVWADVWKNTSLVAFFLLAGLTTIPRDLYEAARVDGYGRWGSFVHITLPLLRPVIVVVLVLRTIEAFKVFDIIYVMTGGGPANGTQSIAYLHLPAGVLRRVLRLRLRAGLPDRHLHHGPGDHLHPAAALRQLRDGVMRDSRRYQLFIHATALVVSVVILAPFAWLIIASLSSQADLLKIPLSWIPSHLSFSRYSQIFTSSSGTIFANFRASLVNSLIIASATVAISITVGVFGAYAFARLRFRGQRASLLLFLSTYMVPPIALVIPLYLIMVRLHLLNTRIGLIIVYCTFATPFVLWIMGNYFQTIPRELEDAARIDGCTRIGALFRVILPLARPGLLSTMLFAFLIAWDEFLYALIFTSTTAAKTIPVAIAEFTGRYTTDFGLQAAGGILAAMPPVLIAVVFQRYIVGGLASGAVKG